MRRLHPEASPNERGGRRSFRKQSVNGKKMRLLKTLAKIQRLKNKILSKATIHESIQGVTLPQHALRQRELENGSLELLPLYMHHRLMVFQVSDI